ncbi:MAG: ribonuclease BN [Haloarculaceae archaeon]
MTGETGSGDEATGPDEDDENAGDRGRGNTAGGRSTDGVAADLESLRSDLDALESRIDDRTVHRDDLEAELKRYVRARQRRGHATGWGPYLVLLYGTAMTVAAFYYLGGVWAILAMVVVWLSTLGLFVVMLVVGGFLGLGRRLGGLRDLVGKLR